MTNYLNPTTTTLEQIVAHDDAVRVATMLEAFPVTAELVSTASGYHNVTASIIDRESGRITDQFVRAYNTGRWSALEAVADLRAIAERIVIGEYE